jgi:subtilisin-like proprotein convertase family protein
MEITDANGEARFTYTSNGMAGTDTIAASGAIGSAQVYCTAQAHWGSGLTFCSSDVPKPNESGAATVSTLTISDDMTIEDLNVRLYLSHPFDNEVRVALTSPYGTTIILFISVGGSGRDFGTSCIPVPNCVIDDQAETGIEMGAAPFVGHYKSQGRSLRTFQGLRSQGTWKLTLVDQVGSGEGMLNCWCLELNSPSPGGAK